MAVILNFHIDQLPVTSFCDTFILASLTRNSYSMLLFFKDMFLKKKILIVQTYIKTEQITIKTETFW